MAGLDNVLEHLHRILSYESWMKKLSHVDTFDTSFVPLGQGPECGRRTNIITTRSVQNPYRQHAPLPVCSSHANEAI